MNECLGALNLEENECFGENRDTSTATCSRHPRPTRGAKWFDSKVRQALHCVRRARQQMFAKASPHNGLRYAVARKQLHYQVVVAKRSHARHFVASVKPGSDLWRLNSWHQGIRKTVVPTLKDPNSDPKFPIWVSDAADKAKLLATSWFPTTKPTIDPPPHTTDRSPTRPYRSVSHEEIMECLNATSNTSAPGLSGLNYKVSLGARALGNGSEHLRNIEGRGTIYLAHFHQAHFMPILNVT